ncbi:MAG: SIS domain-containing protein [Opitutae bacterium]|nr:SIS domain-containing protein [Opitutae bacterium]MCD8299242.1 SIS domain-containing protein [Opitutae bacterium]
MHRQIEKLLSRYPLLAECGDTIQAATDALAKTFSGGGKLLLCGNGGSAADADHISGELLKGFCSKRPLNHPAVRQRLGEELASKLQDALPAIPLHSLGAINTAWLNDCDPYYVYAQLVWGLGKRGDALLGISTSGNSKNVCAAMEVAREKGMATVALSGKTGGRLKTLANICICVPESETFKIQELHLPVYHAICLALEDIFFG